PRPSRQPAAPRLPRVDTPPDPLENAPEPRYVSSAPVIILPAAARATAPTLVQPRAEEVHLLQSAPALAGADQIVLDTLSYPAGGAVLATGRGRPGHGVRAYVNLLYEAETPISPDGSWRLTISEEAALAALLLRFDEVGPDGQVTSRIEAPFTYAEGGPAQALREREVVIQRGDHLWELAEQFYGEGLRYSLIYEANANLIRNPDLIYPGQIFSVPELVAVDAVDRIAPNR
ncbi:MAG: LysM peptidoglycan-binding domain-containing protein, partial [Paracoccaceae bacterium]